MAGVASWGTRQLQGPLWVDGVLFARNGTTVPLSWEPRDGPVVIRTDGGRDITQGILSADTLLPLSRYPLSAEIEWVMSRDADGTAVDAEESARVLRRVTTLRGYVRLFIGLWRSDLWRQAQEPGAVAWRTSRPLPYGMVSGISLGAMGQSWDPVVYLDGVQQVVIGTGIPSTGEVLVEATTDRHGTLTLPAGTSFTELTADYPAVLWAVISAAEESDTWNRYTLRISIQEGFP